jgi:tRNA(Ile2) C34 agmatinyltransferase TiaS
MFISAHETQAHQAIVRVIDDARNWLITEHAAVRRMQPALETFAPRCPACRNPLAAKCSVGLTRFFCKCGHSFSEVR